MLLPVEKFESAEKSTAKKSRDDCIARNVEDLIRVLGLEECRDTFVGGADMPGISGGQRKRVSAGVPDFKASF